MQDGVGEKMRMVYRFQTGDVERYWTWNEVMNHELFLSERKSSSEMAFMALCDVVHSDDFTVNSQRRDITKASKKSMEHMEFVNISIPRGLKPGYT